MAKMDRLENLILAGMASGGYPLKGTMRQRKPAVTAVDMVFETIKRSRKGLGFADIQAKTGFEEKKIRNIIFRLNKIGKIKRKSRGIYVASWAFLFILGTLLFPAVDFVLMQRIFE